MADFFVPKSNTLGYFVRVVRQKLSIYADEIPMQCDKMMRN